MTAPAHPDLVVLEFAVCSTRDRGGFRRAVELARRPRVRTARDRGAGPDDVGQLPDGPVRRPHPRRPVQLRRARHQPAVDDAAERDPRHGPRSAVGRGRPGPGQEPCRGAPVHRPRARLALRRTGEPAHRARQGRPEGLDDAGGRRADARDHRLASLVPPATRSGRARPRRAHPLRRSSSSRPSGCTSVDPMGSRRAGSSRLPTAPGTTASSASARPHAWCGRSGSRSRLTSTCDHWVVYTEPEHAICVEPQSGPPERRQPGAAPCRPWAAAHGVHDVAVVVASEAAAEKR